MGPAILGLLVVAVIVVGLGVMRSNAEKKRLAIIAHADSVRAAAVADSMAAIQRDSLRADSVRTAALPKPSPKPTPAATASRAPASTPSGGGAAAAAPAAPTRKYGLIVGEYIDEAKANEVKDKLTASTSLPGRVISVDNGNAFRVILGSFDGRAAAEKAAGELASKGDVNEARVTALPK
jgi:cell division protein FtsN